MKVKTLLAMNLGATLIVDRHKNVYLAATGSLGKSNDKTTITVGSGYVYKLSDYRKSNDIDASKEYIEAIEGLTGSITVNAYTGATYGINTKLEPYLEINFTKSTGGSANLSYAYYIGKLK